jgi:hypothetical protein
LNSGLLSVTVWRQMAVTVKANEAVRKKLDFSAE